MHKVATLFFLTLLFLIPSSAYAQSAAEDPHQQMVTQLSQIEERVKKIEKDQQEVLLREDKILEELTRLRYMTHRK